MSYQSLKHCVDDLEKNGYLVHISQEVDPNLEMAEIHRRVFEVGGPALFFENVKGSSFPAVSNLFGTLERSRFIFRDTLESLKFLFKVKADPTFAFKNISQAFGLPRILLSALPRKVNRGPCLENTTKIAALPQIKSWPEDGGAFVLLPQVYTEDPQKPSFWNSNTGMYRIQISGNEYEQDHEIGLHYQIRRDIGIHHTKAKQMKKRLPVSIFVGGPPSHTFASVMFLPEKLPEAAFAGALGGRQFRYARVNENVVSTDADFCILGSIDPEETKPEGPFGDHLGYYSLKHPFPVMRVEKVYHRRDAIWPFTVVGRPPQEDTSFGKLIQEIAGPLIPVEIPGVKEVHAVDAAGVHPLLLAIGSERYLPYAKKEPRELLTLANAILGYGPCSLAKYLWIATDQDNRELNTHKIVEFFEHILERVDWRRDLHFQTQTTMDTLDYSGTELNKGSKVVIAAAGEPVRSISNHIPEKLSQLAEFLEKPLAPFRGCLVLKGQAFTSYEGEKTRIRLIAEALEAVISVDDHPLIVLCDDSGFAAKNINNFLWTVFTKSDPARDIYGIGESFEFKHWGCRGSLIIDARQKPHHAPPLIENKKVSARVDQMAKRGGILHGIL